MQGAPAHTNADRTCGLRSQPRPLPQRLSSRGSGPRTGTVSCRPQQRYVMCSVPPHPAWCPAAAGNSRRFPDGSAAPLSRAAVRPGRTAPPPSRRSKSQATGAGEVHVPRRACACRVVSCHRLKHRQPSSARRQAPRVRPGRARNGPQACDSSLQLECVRPYFSTDPAARNIIFPSSFLFLSQSFRPEVSRGRERRMLRALGLASPMPRAQKAKTEDSDAEV